MCMSVPQIAVLAISISTSLCPTLGSGMSSSQIPGAACCLTSAFMSLALVQSLLEDTELAADLGEGGHGALELRARERCRHLRADARLALRHHRVREADHVHAAFQQPVGHAAGERRIPQHHRNDGMLAWLQVESRARHRIAEETRVLEQLLAQLRAALEQIEHREARGHYHRRDAVGEEVRT